MTEAIEFLHDFYGSFEHEGVFTIIAMLKTNEDGSPRGKSLNRVFKVPLSEIPHFNWGAVKELNEQKFDIYFGEALRDPAILDGPAYARGVAAECIWSGALSLDIDTKQPGAHVNEDLPETVEDVSKILDIGPEPSMVVHSGYGYHAHWYFTEPVLLRDKSERNQYSRYRKKAHAPYMKAHKAHGWKGDATHNIDRIWRVPGFLNWKIPDSPVPVTVFYKPDERVTHEHTAFIPDGPAPSSKPKPKLPRTPRQKAEQASAFTGLRKSIQSYIEKCYDDALVASEDEETADVAEDIAARGVYMERLLAGESIEDKGQRDQALTIVCGILCLLTRRITEFSDDDLEFIVTDLMAASLQKWCDDNEDTDIEREMGKAIDKLRRIKAKDQDQESEAVQGLRNALSEYQPKALDDSGEIETEPEEGPTDEELLRTALILYKGHTFIWDWPNQQYWGRAISKDNELRGKMRDCWPEGGDCPLVHSIVNEEGQAVELPKAHIEKNYATTAVDAYYTFLEPRTVYSSASQTIKINPRPWRETESGYTESIDEWLKHLGGETNYELLCDWLAGCIKLDHPCAALYLHGPPGCGKTLFATGATQLWSKTPAMYEHAVGNFNEALMNSPIILVDEGFVGSNAKNPTAILRRLVATRTHTVNEKHGLKARLDGYLRVIVAANNDGVLLSGKEERLSENDTRAMKERIAYVHIKDDKARDFFARYNKGNKLTREWIGQGQFARHLLWLAEQRPLSDRGRFLVEGEDSPMHKQMLFQGNERNEVLEWCCLFAEAPKKLNRNTKEYDAKPALIGDGIVAINTKLARSRWSEFSSNKDILTHSHLLRHLKSLSPLDAAISVKVSSKSSLVVRYWVIPIDLILSYADSHDIGDIEAIRRHAEDTTDTTNALINSKHAKALAD